MNQNPATPAAEYRQRSGLLSATVAIKPTQCGQQLLAGSLVTVVWLSISVDPAAAHGAAQTGGTTIPVPTIAVLITVFSAAAGLVAIVARSRFRLLTAVPYADRVIGFLFIGIGAAASVSILLREPAIALGGGSIGLLGGIILTSYTPGNARPELAVGAIAIHRLIEGSTLAAIAVTGRAISIVGVAVLALHAVLECISIGLYSKFTHLQALGAVLAITVGFTLGLGIGTIGLAAIGAPMKEWVVATVAGLLIVFGTAEAQLNLVRHVRENSQRLFSQG